MLAHALAVDPDDSRARQAAPGEGHMARINGTAHRNAAALNEAVREIHRSAAPAAQIARPGAGPGARLRLRPEGHRQGLRRASAGRSAGLPAGRPREAATGRRLPRPRRPRCGGIRATCAACRRRRTRSSAPPTITRRALELYQGIAPYGNASAQHRARAARAWTACNSGLQRDCESARAGGPATGARAARQ